MFGQARNAQDASAQSAVTELAARVQACRVDARATATATSRASCVTSAPCAGAGAPGEAGVLPARSTEQSFTAYAVSGSGPGSTCGPATTPPSSKHTCRHGSVPRLEREGCDGPGW